MTSNKVEMSLDDIIKSSRKEGKKGNQPTKKAGGLRKGPIKKKGFKGGFKGNKEAKVTPATKKLVNELVQQALAKRGIKNAQSPQKTFVRKVNPRSRVIKKRTGGGQTETVIVRKIQRPIQKPRSRVIREVIVEEPRRRFNRPVQRRIVEQRPRQKVVYIQKQQQPQRRRFNNGRRNDPFYEPTNYLQRI